MCTHGDLKATWGMLRCTRSQGWSIPDKCKESATLRSGPGASVLDEVSNARCGSPRGSLLWNWTRLSTHKVHKKVPAWLTGSIRNIYRTDILTTINDNWLPLSECGRRNGTARWEKNYSMLIRPSVSSLCTETTLTRYANLIFQLTVS